MDFILGDQSLLLTPSPQMELTHLFRSHPSVGKSCEAPVTVWSMHSDSLLICIYDSKRSSIDNLDDTHADYIFDMDVNEDVNRDYPKYSVDSTNCGQLALFQIDFKSRY